MINSVNRPTHARYQFLYSFPAVTFSISRSTQNELKMSSGQNAVPVCCPGLKKEQSSSSRVTYSRCHKQTPVDTWSFFSGGEAERTERETRSETETTSFSSGYIESS